MSTGMNLLSFERERARRRSQARRRGAAGARFQAAGRVAGQRVETSLLPERVLAGDRSDAALDRVIEGARDACRADPDDRIAMECLGKRVSTDFATIDFVARLYDRRNRP